MENATKALLMGAGVLIGIMILSLAVYLFVSFGGTAQRIQNQIDQSELDAFNNRFISYQAKECTVYDILTVVNMANEFNASNQFGTTSTNYIQVWVKDSATTTQKFLNPFLSYSKLTINDFFKIDDWYQTYTDTTVDPDPDAIYTNKFELKKFKCTVEINDETQRVKRVWFER